METRLPGHYEWRLGANIGHSPGGQRTIQGHLRRIPEVALDRSDQARQRAPIGVVVVLFCTPVKGPMTEKRKLAAILAADVVGFSRLTGTDEDRTLARLRALRSDLIDPTISALCCTVDGCCNAGPSKSAARLVPRSNADGTGSAIRFAVYPEKAAR